MEGGGKGSGEAGAAPFAGVCVCGWMDVHTHLTHAPLVACGLCVLKGGGLCQGAGLM